MKTHDKKIAFLLIAFSMLLSGMYANEQKVNAGTPLVAPQKEETKTQPIISETYSVIRVVDGDTLVIKKDGAEIKVRLIGLNTPEIVDPRRIVECFGKEASARAKEILTGQMVKIETDPTQSVYDKYARLLAYVYLADGTNFNEQMIREGYGHEYTYNTPYLYQKEFKQAEEYARTHELGLWKPGVCE